MSKTITCPECDKTFDLDDDAYAKIRSQVKDEAFETDLNARLEEKTKALKAEHALDKKTMEQEHSTQIAEILNQHEKDVIALEHKNNETELALERSRDLRARQSTKMIGESLEIHCETEFNKLRPTAFQNDLFEKDTEVVEGTKGDFVYRNYDDQGNEIVSIMFEMKNEEEEGSTKQRNSSHYKKLDKDRNNKNCEYAVLVSLLEPQSDYFNTGIVDVSHEGFKKMYVVRPQFFIQTITLLRNAAQNSLESKQELARIREQEVDIANLEANLKDFAKSFDTTTGHAFKNYEKTIVEIDKAIKSLENAKEHLRKSGNQLINANKKLEEISIEKLVKDSPSLQT